MSWDGRGQGWVPHSLSGLHNALLPPSAPASHRYTARINTTWRDKCPARESSAATRCATTPPAHSLPGLTVVLRVHVPTARALWRQPVPDGAKGVSGSLPAEPSCRADRRVPGREVGRRLPGLGDARNPRERRRMMAALLPRVRSEHRAPFHQICQLANMSSSCGGQSSTNVTVSFQLILC